jgi:hypothetical protein
LIFQKTKGNRLDLIKMCMFFLLEFFQALKLSYTCFCLCNFYLEVNKPMATLHPIWCTKQHMLEILIDLTQCVVVVTIIVAIYGCCSNIKKWNPRSINAHFCTRCHCPFNQLLFKFWHTQMLALPLVCTFVVMHFSFSI